MQPPPYPQSPYPVPPTRRGNLVLVLGLGAGSFLLLVLAGVIVVLVTSGGGSSGKVRGTLQFRKVLSVTNTACPAGRSEWTSSVKGDVCYQLGDGMTITRAEAQRYVDLVEH